MANQLQKLGELMFKLKWWVIAFWVVVMAILGAIVSQVGFNTTSDISIPGTQAQQALTRFNELFPDTGAQSAKVVIEVPEGKTITDYTTEINALAENITKVEGVTAAITPYVNTAAVSEDNTIGFITVQMKGEGDSGRLSDATIAGVNGAIADGQIEGATVVAGGDLIKQEVGEILGVAEIAGLVVALIVLLVTLGSLIAAGLPLLTALAAVGVSMLGLFALSQTIDLTNTAPVLAVMLGLAVGIDYSLFIINRYRTYVIDGYEIKTASGRAIATAGNAVIFAAVTVVIALAALSVVQIPFMTVMGLAAAATVAIAALVAITLIPALLGILKLNLFSRKTRKAIKEQQAKGIVHHEDVNRTTMWYRLGERIVKFRKTFLIGALAVVALLAWPMVSLQLGLPTDETAAEGTSQRDAYELLAKGFGDGYNGPLLLVVEGLPATTDADKKAVREGVLAEYQKQLEAKASELGITTQQLQMSMTPQRIAEGQAQLEQRVAQYAPYYQLQSIATSISEDVDGVAQAQAALVTDNGTKGVIQVTPTTGPSDEETKNLVAYFRDESNQAALAKSDNVTFGVTGTTAIQIDINKKLADAMPVYLAVVVGLSFIILMIAFRSVLIPIKATLGFLLSVAAMFGALVAVFQWGWLGIADAPAPIVSFIPIIAIGILFGLAMDYEFFLVSGMQEAFHYSKKAKQAVTDGFAIGSRVVVAAALIMVSVFAGFIGNHDSTIQSIGFALSLGVLIDAFVVRLVIVPIIMSYLGKAAWWLPKWLDKILPRVSIEGK